MTIIVNCSRVVVLMNEQTETRVDLYIPKLHRYYCLNCDDKLFDYSLLWQSFLTVNTSR